MKSLVNENNRQSIPELRNEIVYVIGEEYYSYAKISLKILKRRSFVIYCYSCINATTDLQLARQTMYVKANCMLYQRFIKKGQLERVLILFDGGYRN